MTMTMKPMVSGMAAIEVSRWCQNVVVPARAEPGDREEREAHRDAVHLGDDHFSRRTLAEQLLGQQRFGSHHLVVELLVRGQLADESED